MQFLSLFSDLKVLVPGQSEKSLWIITIKVKFFYLSHCSAGLWQNKIFLMVLDVTSGINCSLHKLFRWLKLLEQDLCFLYSVIKIESFDSTAP